MPDSYKHNIHRATSKPDGFKRVLNSRVTSKTKRDVKVELNNQNPAFACCPRLLHDKLSVLSPSDEPSIYSLQKRSWNLFSQVCNKRLWIINFHPAHSEQQQLSIAVQ